MSEPRPYMYDGTYTRGPDGALVRVIEPRWYELGKIFDLLKSDVVRVTFNQCGREVICRAKPVKTYE